MKALQFYTSTAMRDAERVNAWSGLLCPNWRVWPFQIQRPALSSTGLTSAFLIDCNDDATNIFPQLEIEVNERSVHDFITYKGNPFDTEMDYGVYYIRASDGNTTWYSDWLSVENIQPSLLTGWTATGYSEFTVNTGGSRPDVDILKATSAGAASAESNTFTARKGEQFYLTSEYSILTAPVALSVEVVDSGGTTISNAISPSSGDIETNTFTIRASDTLSKLKISNVPGTFSVDRFALRRRHGEFIFIEYSNTNDIQGKTSLDYSLTSDSESILYSSGFTQEVYLDANMTTPSHEMIETGEDKNGVFQAEKMVDTLVHSVVAYESWSLFRALRILPLHDDIEIIDRVGQAYNPSQGNVRVAVDWDTFDTGSLRIDWNELGDVWTSNMDNIV
ncbi:hypothetical protein KAR91_68815 [Candidatus Pacearchaeota archaeon]|nr:hypothetical protein [Candidatus Pacearchaeota archaeon]